MCTRTRACSCVFIFYPHFLPSLLSFPRTRAATEKQIHKRGIKGQLTQNIYFSFLSPCTMCTQTLTAVCKSWSYFGVSSMERILPNGQKTAAMWSGQKKNVPSFLVWFYPLVWGGDSTHTERSRSMQSSCLTFSTQKRHVSAAKGLKDGVQVFS